MIQQKKEKNLWLVAPTVFSFGARCGELLRFSVLFRPLSLQISAALQLK